MSFTGRPAPVPFARLLPWVALFCLTNGATLWAADPADIAVQAKRGQSLFIAHCIICHQVTGHGTPGVYPPLAGSDYLARADGRTGAILAVVQGLGGNLKVNGQDYANQMPAVVLDDPQVADVLTFVFNSWGNPGGSFAASDVKTIRARSNFKTFAQLVEANAYPPLPSAPAGFEVRELVRLTDFGVRLASDGRGERLYVLGQNGNVWRVDVATKKATLLFTGDSYVDRSHGDPGTLGLFLDSHRRLWITCNQRNGSTRPLVTNEVTIFRTAGAAPGGDPISPKPWFRTAYPYGIGPYNHGVSQPAIGPDGRLYVSSGSRTDGGEKGSDERLGRMGEVDLTSCLWRFDPEASEPAIEVVARGIRNAWSFAWDGAGNLFTVSNGPDAHACEEMDWIQPEKHEHHGFPYQFEDWPASKKAYPHTPAAPDGLAFSLPVRNVGPAGKPADRDGRTFQPHSSPAGLVWLDDRWPEAWRGTFLMGRFGNLVTTGDGVDVGFDVLSLRLRRSADGTGWESETRTFLAPLGRPIDLHVAGGRLYVLEYTRPTDFKTGRGWLPGRILELSPRRGGQ